MELGFARVESKKVKQKGKGPKEDGECLPRVRVSAIPQNKTFLQTDGGIEEDVTKEALTSYVAQFTRGYSGHGLESDGSSSNSSDPLEVLGLC